MNGLKSSNKGADDSFDPGRPPGRFFLQDQRGGVSFKTLFWTLLLASLLYGSYKFLPPYFSFYMLKTDVEDEAKIAHMYSDEELEKRILQNAQTWGIPIDKDNVDISRGRSDITISVHYSDTIEFPGGYAKQLDHEVTVQKPLKDTSRVLQ